MSGEVVGLGVLAAAFGLLGLVLGAYGHAHLDAGGRKAVESCDRIVGKNSGTYSVAQRHASNPFRALPNARMSQQWNEPWPPPEELSTAE
jgi:hypothetical protein